MKKAITTELYTERLLLRNLRLNDVNFDYVSWLNDPDVNKYLSCANRRQTLDSCYEYVESFQGYGDRALIGVFLRKGALHIGNMTLFPPVDWDNKVGTIGISIGRKEYWKKGYAREALAAFITYCFEQLKLNRLQAGIHGENINSLRLFTACGFKIERSAKEKILINGKHENEYLASLHKCDYNKTSESTQS